MSNVNLKAELEATRLLFADQVDALLTEEGLEYLDLETLGLAQLGIQTSVSQRQALKKQQREAFLAEVYTEQQIEKLCIQYRLRCLEVGYFKGKMDEEVPARKLAFEEAFESVVGQDVATENYRIVAPAEMFRLKNVPLDPLLLYRFQEGGAWYYKLVHQWGGDLNGWRAVSSYPLRSAAHLTLCSLAGWSVFLFVLITMVLSVLGEFNWATVGTLISCLVPALTCMSVTYFRDINGSLQTSDRVWNVEYR